jgi:hypothetical protein
VYKYDFSTQTLDTTTFPENSFTQQTQLGDSATSFTTVYPERFDLLGPNVSRFDHTVEVFNNEGVTQRIFEIGDPGYTFEQIGPTTILYGERVKVILGASNEQFVVVSIDLNQSNINDVTPTSTGRAIGFNLSSDLAILDVRTGAIDRIVQNNAVARQFSLDTPEYQFDPADKEITSQGVDTPPRVGTLDVFGGDDVAITPDGRFVIFESGNEGSGQNGILVFDRTTRQTENITITANGTPATGSFFLPDVSDDGRYVTFLSNSDDLGGATNSSQFVFSVYVHDRVTGTTELVSKSLTDEDVFVNSSAAPQISGDGSSIVFVTSSGDVVEGDTNDASDIFVADNPFFSLPTDGTDDDDFLAGAFGDDVINAGLGDDVVLVAGGDNTVNAGGGDDSVGFASGNNVANGGAGGDLLVGGLDNDVLNGESDNDVIIGDISDFIGGADTINGGTGDDLLEGGVGADVFIFGTNDGADTIGTLDVNFGTLSNTTASGADFVSGVDLIALEAGFGITTGADALSNVTDVAGVATFTDQCTTITFAGLTTSDLAADDFTFL